MGRDNSEYWLVLSVFFYLEKTSVFECRLSNFLVSKCEQFSVLTSSSLNTIIIPKIKTPKISLIFSLYPKYNL